MLQIRVFLILVGTCYAAIALIAPMRARALGGEGIAPEWARTAGTIPLLFLTALAAAVGATLAPSVGLSAPFFEALVGPGTILPVLRRQAIPAVLLGLVATVGGLLLYYGVFRPRLDAGDVLRFERVRLRLGVLARVLQGGLVEEVVYRWGLMTFIAWFGALVLGRASVVVMWFSIVTAGALFGLAHLSGTRLLGVRRTPWLVGTAVVVNLWLGVICGWLFWQYGLLAAMFAHGLMHGIWVSFDGWFYRRLAMGPAD